MSNLVLQYAREKEPRFADVPDDELTQYIGERHPEFLQEPSFKTVFEARAEQRQNTFQGDVAREGAKIADFLGAAADTVARFPERAASNAGSLINWTGEMLAEDVGNTLSAVAPTLDRSGPVYQGLQEAGRTIPQVGAAMGLTALGVPAPLAFGAPAGAATYAAGGDAGAAAKSAAVAAVIPGAANAARQATGRVLAAGLNRGIGPTSPVAQKAIEAVGSQTGVQALLEGLHLPEYLQMSPDERREAIVRNAFANLAFLPMDAPHVLRRGPSDAQNQVRPETDLALALRDRVNDPRVIDNLLALADEEALLATDPRAAQQTAEPARRSGPVILRPASETTPAPEAPLSQELSPAVVPETAPYVELAAAEPTAEATLTDAPRLAEPPASEPVAATPDPEAIWESAYQKATESGLTVEIVEARSGEKTVKTLQGAKAARALKRQRGVRDSLDAIRRCLEGLSS